MEIIRKNKDNIEFYTVALTGQSGMSQSGLAILAGVTQQALSQLEKTLTSRSPSEHLESFVGEPLTLTISDPKIDGRLVGNLKIYKAIYCAAVLAHYASPPNSNQTALVSLLKFTSRGVTDWIQEITGWKKTVDSIQPYTDVYIQRIENMRDHKIADHLWMIFREAAELLLLIEKDWRVPVNDFDILDGSIGRRWSDYRREQDWVTEPESYMHSYRDQRGKRECFAYVMNELPYFRRWLREFYIPIHLPEYLVTKYGRQAVRQIYAEIGQLTDYVLEITEVKRMTPQESDKYQNFLISRQKLLGEFDP